MSMYGLHFSQSDQRIHSVFQSVYNKDDNWLKISHAVYLIKSFAFIFEGMVFGVFYAGLLLDLNFQPVDNFFRIV